MTLDYLYGFGVASPNRRKSKFFLVLSVINNLGILAVFKYYNFFAGAFQSGLGLLGIHVQPVLLNIALPIGISFYTFHGMSYVFDIYRGLRKPVKNFSEYALFVCFFPLLVAGPIERANHLLPQVQFRRTFDYTQAVEGCRLILWGMFKKVVIADSLSVVVDSSFADYNQHSALSLIIGAVSFSFQIYGDFSGYSDIAIGTAKLFGFELLSNFKFPYFSRDIAEFWRRWHISLTSWFRDYLYIPLGGSRKGTAITVRNVLLIFLISGFWHGAGWNFLIWGGIHAIGFLPILLLNRNRTHVTDIVARDKPLPSFRELRQMACTFIFVTFAWIFFRVSSLEDSASLIRRIFADSLRHPGQYLHPAGELMKYSAVFWIIPLLAADWWFRRDERRLRIPNKSLETAISWAMTLLIISKFSIEAPFIYFQF